jgi:hypothetical protein
MRNLLDMIPLAATFPLGPVAAAGRIGAAASLAAAASVPAALHHYGLLPAVPFLSPQGVALSLAAMLVCQAFAGLAWREMRNGVRDGHVRTAMNAAGLSVMLAVASMAPVGHALHLSRSHEAGASSHREAHVAKIRMIEMAKERFPDRRFDLLELAASEHRRLGEGAER